MRSGAPPGLNQTFEQAFRRFPLGCPLALMLFGGGAVGIALAFHHRSLIATVPVLLLVAGVIILPFGMRTTIRRRRHPIVLRCPKCQALSRESAEPFQVHRWPDVPYASVTCSGCGQDFTVDRYARLQ